MIIHFLGTGAADWEKPNPDGEYRRFSSTLIDDVLLIDGTESVRDTLPACARIDDVLYTHSHADHFSAPFLRALKPKRAYAEASWVSALQVPGVSAMALFTEEPLKVAGFHVTPLPANHGTERETEQPLHFLIEKDGKRLLYATDGAWLTNRAYHVLKRAGALNAVVFDGTVGDAHSADYRFFEHNSLPMARMMLKSLGTNGLLAPGAKAFVTHLARTLHPSQKVLEVNEESAGGQLIICFDGMRAEI